MNKNKIDLSLFKKSSLGTTVDSKDDVLGVKMEYSGVSWFFITWFGTTRIPRKISFTCLKSNEVFEVLTDKKLMEHYITFRTK